MKILRIAILSILFSLLLSASLSAKERQTREEYVERYKAIAIAHMERYGIPASITMAQGILESDSGNSQLSLSSNNHFGIKCKKSWKGERVYHDDDAKGECFRAYPSVEASYEDHADFLDQSPRYDSLFAYPSDDYRSWARGLKAAQLLISQKDEQIKLLEADNSRMKPKEIFADAVSASDTSILVRDFAKILRQNGVDMGEKRLYKWLRENGYIIKGTTQPTQRAMEMGLFEVIERSVQRSDMSPIVTMTTKITGKGQQYFINKFLAV